MSECRGFSFGEGLRRPVVASIYAAASPAWQANPGTNAHVPFTTTAFQTDSGMHTPSTVDSGTATGVSTTTTLTDTTKSWTTNQYANYLVKLVSGIGVGQWKRIVSNTATTLTIGPTAWGIVPITLLTTYEIYAPTQSQIIVPTTDYYVVSIHAASTYVAGILGTFLYVNGTFESLNYAHQAQTVELNTEHTRLLSLNANDYVEMAVYVGGTTPTQQIFAGATRLWMQLNRV